MRLSKPRVLVRAALLLVGGAYMAWHAWGAHREARALPPGDALLQERIALVWALVAALALATAAAALAALRPRARRHTLRLEDRERDAR